MFPLQVAQRVATELFVLQPEGHGYQSSTLLLNRNTAVMLCERSFQI